MDAIIDGELRFRITIDPEMDELYRRLVKSNSKRRAREAVHLMRMGLMWEAFLAKGGAASKEPAGVQSELTMAGDPARALPSFPNEASTREVEGLPELASYGVSAADYALPKPSQMGA